MATAGWVAELSKPEYKNWVKVGCGLKIAKNGISQLIQQRFQAWYQSLISRPPLRSLARCSCVDGAGTWCRTCVKWEAELSLHHRSSEPRMCWDNSDRKQWGSQTGAWEVAKVFMPTLGSRKTHVIDAETTDIGDLLNLLEWCTFIDPPVRRRVLISVRDKCRHQWAHAPKQELQDTDVNAIFGHLKNLLSDPVFRNNRAAQKSAKDLKDLSKNFLLTVRESEVEALYLLRQSLVADLAKCGEDLADAQGKVVQLDAETKKVHTAVENAKVQGDYNQEEIVKLKEQLDTEVKKIETDANEKISKILNAVEDYNKIRNNRDDLKGSLDLISEDVEHLRKGVQNAAIDLNKTKSQVANLEIDLASVKNEVKGMVNDVATNKNTISGLQKDVLEVKEEVETLKTKLLEEQSSDDSNALFTAPSRLTAFTGREPALAWLEQNLAPEERSENCPGTSCCTKAAICGLGGSGKTSLAVEFSWKYKNCFPGGVFWINGESDDNIGKSIVENLTLLNIPASTSEKLDDILNRFLAKLSRKERQWLLVVDNADDLEDQTCPAGVKKICKGPWQRNGHASKHGHILLTTRRGAKDTETFLKFTSDNCFQLQCFSEEESALFLRQRIGLQGESVDPDAILLAKELGYLPLALEQAAAYISTLPIPCSFKAYLKKYRDVKLRLLKQQPATALSIKARHRLSVHTTWEMNFESVTEKSPAAATMLRIAAFLESDNIPIDVINPGFPELAQEELRESARTEIDVYAILKVLSSYSLFSVDQKRRVFAIHKLVQEVVKESLTGLAKIEILVAASRVLHFAFKSNNEQDIVNSLLLSFRTLKNLMEEESKLLKEDSLRALYNTEILELCTSVCKLYKDDIPFFRVFADLGQFVLRVSRVVYNDADKPDVLLSTMAQISTLKLACSLPEIDNEAKKLSDNAVKMLIELEESGVKVGVDIKFDVLNQSAFFYGVEKQWENYYKVLLELEELPVSVDKFVELQRNIARADYFRLTPCNPQSALRRYQNTLEIARKSFPSNDRRIVSLLQDISDLLWKSDKVEEAKPYAEELWGICKNQIQSPTSCLYIFGTMTAMRVKCNFDPEESENIMMDILKSNWPHIYEIAASTPQRQVKVEEITGDGTDKLVVYFLPCMLDCFFAIYTRKKGEHNFSSSKLNFYRTIAEVNLCIEKSLKAEIHRNMKGTYEYLKLVHVILGNEKEVQRLQDLVDKCHLLASTTPQ